MKIHTLGTSAGTQPFEMCHHVCTAIETKDSLYFIDAGECGAYTAHINGINLLKTKAIFITHPHMDHVGGLGNLLWYIRKVDIVNKKILTEKDSIEIFTPCLESVKGFMTVLENTEGGFECAYSHNTHEYKEGIIFDNGEIKVTAKHTNHMPQKDGKYQSYSFTVECEGKTIVFSGDMRLEDIDEILPEKCDVFFVETGHHQIEEICAELVKRKKTVGKVMFTHNGGYIFRDYESAEKRVTSAFGKNGGEVCRDGCTYEF